MRGPRDAAELQLRREKVVAEILLGVKIGRVADKWHVSRTSIHRWLKADSLAARKATGRPVKVDRDKLRELYNERSPIWTPSLFQDAICNNFGVDYDVDHCGRLLNLFRGEVRE